MARPKGSKDKKPRRFHPNSRLNLLLKKKQERRKSTFEIILKEPYASQFENMTPLERGDLISLTIDQRNLSGNPGEWTGLPKDDGSLEWKEIRDRLAEAAIDHSDPRQAHCIP